MFSSPKHITRLSVLANSMLITGSCAGNRRLQCFAEWMPECAEDWEQRKHVVRNSRK
jgi:hypothetical protein